MVKYNDRGNLAHKLDMPYDEPVQEHADKEDEEVRSRTGRKTKVRTQPAMSIKSRVAWGILLSIAISLMGSLIYGKVEISRLYNEKSGLEKQLTRLQNENVSMQSEIAERMNMTKVEEYARNDLGLQKLDKSQIEYIEVDSPSVAEVKSDSEEGVFVRIKHWLNSFGEYIGL
ncbi:septum formation initiator family protein [uncultured Ruminococcus sp.]|uniref:septum formation initiator family protein n=1 Tax=uncultured Ruminococcus sp. TaxID=165186 RepID=UPI0025CCA3FA|nr:septum formation initiator family protein [uncultured Ruminococcus sp.]